MFQLYIDTITIESFTPNYNVPQNLTAATGNGSVSLTWQAPAARPTVTGYKVYRNGTMLTADLVTGLTYNDITVTPGTQYAYYVVAHYTGPTGDSGPSNTVNITPSFNPPLSLTATPAIGQIALNWLAPTGAGNSGYKVYRNAVALTPTPITALTYTDTNVQLGTSYTYYVTAMYTTPIAGESTASNNVQSTPLEQMDPPTNLTATVNNYNVVLNWVAPGAPPPNPLNESFESTTFPPTNWTQVITETGGANTYGVYPT